MFYKVLASVFGFLSFGGLLERYRIMTSDAIDIAPQRFCLTIMSLTMLILFNVDKILLA